MKFGQHLEKSDKFIVGVTLLCALFLFSWLVHDIAFTNSELSGNIEVGKIYQLQNNVKRKFNRSLIWYSAGKDETVYENDWIFTGSNSLAKIKLRSGGEIIIEPDSLIVLTRKNGVLQLDLQHGRLMANVAKDDIKINVMRNGAVETVDTETGIVSISQKERSNEVNIDIVPNDQNQDGVEDLSISKIADRKYYTPKSGFSDLQTNGISYQPYNLKTMALFEGQKTDVPFNWEDPLNEWSSYEIEIATDEHFTNILKTESTTQPGYTLNTSESGPYYWRVRGIGSQGNISKWSETLTSDLQVEKRSRGNSVKLAQKNFEYQLNIDEASKMRADNTHTISAKEKSIKIKWVPDENAVNYKVQISDKEDFSNILEEKIISEDNLDIQNVQLGQTFFKIVPENAQGIAVAKEAIGEINTFLPAPRDESLKTIDETEFQTISWEKVPHAKMYEVTYIQDKETMEPKVKYVESNQVRIDDSTGYLQWKVRAVNPTSKKKIGSYSKTVDWYDAAKKLASVPGSGQAGTDYPIITSPNPRKTFITVNKSPLFIAMEWMHQKNIEKYEVEISTKPDMSQPVYKQSIFGKKRTIIKQNFSPGVYYMRVRALNGIIADEAWSAVEVFRVINRDL